MLSATSTVLVTGANGHIGWNLCCQLRAAGRDVLAVDIQPDAQRDIAPCDIRRNDDIVQRFETRPVRTVIHLAGVLPTAFRADPITGAEVNLTGTIALLRQAARHRVERFVFGSSLSVYGRPDTARALTERDRAAPDEPYGAAKRMVELVGEGFAAGSDLQFAALRMARVVGPGARNTASRWRSQVFEAADSGGDGAITIPFAPTARLCLVHVDEVARMLMILSDAPDLPHVIYNSPAETWETQAFAQLVQDTKGVRVEMGEAAGGPISDGSLFTKDFGFRLRGLADHLSTGRGLTCA